MNRPHDKTTTYNGTTHDITHQQKNPNDQDIDHLKMNQRTGVTFRPAQGDDLNQSPILLSSICSLLLLPIAFHFITSQQEPTVGTNRELYEWDLLAGLLVVTFTFLLVYVINSILKSRESILTRQHYNYQHQLNRQQHQQQHQNQTKSSRSNLFYQVFCGGEFNSFKEKLKNNQRRIDSKYFNPKFIYHELMEIWGTTYTVITWSSFYLVGGTVGVTERFAQKLKTKYRDSQYNSNSGSGGRHNSSTRSSGVGRRPTERDEQSSSTSFGCFFRPASSSESAGENGDGRRAASGIRRRQEGKNSRKKSVSTWTKRSFESAKRKFNRIIGNSDPLLRIGELDDSNGRSIAA